MEILNKQLSPEASCQVNIAQGKLMLSALVDTKGADANVQVSVDTDYFLDELAKKIPGVIDDAVIGLLKSALKAL